MCLRLDDSQCLLVKKKSQDPSNSNRSVTFFTPNLVLKILRRERKIFTYTFKDNGYKKKGKIVLYIWGKKKKKRMEGAVCFFLTAPPFVDPY